MPRTLDVSAVAFKGAPRPILTSLKTAPSTRSVGGSKQETSVLRQRALRVEARIQRTGKPSLRLRGVVFGAGTERYQILLFSRDDQPLGAQAWDKLVSSIRRPKP